MMAEKWWLLFVLRAGLSREESKSGPPIIVCVCVFGSEGSYDDGSRCRFLVTSKWNGSCDYVVCCCYMVCYCWRSR